MARKLDFAAVREIGLGLPDVKDPAVLVRLSIIGRRSLRDMLTKAWQLAGSKATR